MFKIMPEQIKKTIKILSFGTAANYTYEPVIQGPKRVMTNLVKV